MNKYIGMYLLYKRHFDVITLLFVSLFFYLA